MIICNVCGAELDKLGSCPECGASTDEAMASPESSAKTPEEVTEERLANLQGPIPETTGDKSTKASPSGASTPGKTVAPRPLSASRTPATEPPSHEEMMALLHAMGKRLVLIRRSVNQHGKAVVGVLTAIFLVLLGIFGQELWQRWQHPQPDAIWIQVEPNASQVREGTPVKLIARTSPAENVPREFKWQPAEMIDGNGQQSVTLNTNTSQRHTESYPVTVSLIAVDQLGNNCVAVKDVTITIVPPQKWNHAPELTETIHIEGSPGVKSGTSVSLQALARDRDGDNLTYTWSVGNHLVTIEGNGNRRVVLRIPKDFARPVEVPLTIKLTVSDGINSIADFLPITVLRGGSVRVSRPKPRSVPPKLAIPPTQPSSSPPLKGESELPKAVPQSSPQGSGPGRS